MPTTYSVPYTVVSIGVVDLPDGPVYQRAIRIFPNRLGDVVVFHAQSQQASVNSPERPREIRWEAWGLFPGETLEISAKTGTRRNAFPSTQWTISGRSSSMVAMSGPVQAHVQPGSHVDWEYQVRLVNGGGKDLAQPIDPPVVIYPDP